MQECAVRRENFLMQPRDLDSAKAHLLQHRAVQHNWKTVGRERGVFLVMLQRCIRRLYLLLVRSFYRSMIKIVFMSDAFKFHVFEIT